MDEFRIELTGTANDFSRTAKCGNCGAFLAHYSTEQVEAIGRHEDHQIKSGLARKLGECTDCKVSLFIEGDYSRAARAEAALSRKD